MMWKRWLKKSEGLETSSVVILCHCHQDHTSAQCAKLRIQWHNGTSVPSAGWVRRNESWLSRAVRNTSPQTEASTRVHTVNWNIALAVSGVTRSLSNAWFAIQCAINLFSYLQCPLVPGGSKFWAGVLFKFTQWRQNKSEALGQHWQNQSKGPVDHSTCTSRDKIKKHV